MKLNYMTKETMAEVEDRVQQAMALGWTFNHSMSSVLIIRDPNNKICLMSENINLLIHPEHLNAAGVPK